MKIPPGKSSPISMLKVFFLYPILSLQRGISTLRRDYTINERKLRGKLMAGKVT
jgi:hypothetical protein